jgi:hypothetical protein
MRLLRIRHRAGTQGVRAEHARIDAIWLRANVPYWMRRRVASRYPSARLYTERTAMLAEHPPTVLPCYAPMPRARIVPRAGAVALATGLLTLGVLPGDWLYGSAALHGTWLAATVALGLTAIWLLAVTRMRGHRAAAWIAAGVLAWLIAPVFGVAGWVLRVPVLRALAVGAGGYLLSLRPGYFPVEHGAHERTFCGVHAA